MRQRFRIPINKKIIIVGFVNERFYFLRRFIFIQGSQDDLHNVKHNIVTEDASHSAKNRCHIM